MSSSFTLFSRWFAPETFSRLCTLFFIAGGMGGLLATTPLSLANHWVGWRLVFLALSVLTCSLTVIIHAVVRDWPPHLAATGNGIRLADVLRDVAAMAKQPDFWKMIVWYLSLPSQYFVFHGLWGAVYLGGTFGLSPSLIGNILAMGAVGFIAGTPLLTWISEKRLKSRRKTLVLASLLACVSAAALSLGSDSLGVPPAVRRLPGPGHRGQRSLPRGLRHRPGALRRPHGGQPERHPGFIGLRGRGPAPAALRGAALLRPAGGPAPSLDMGLCPRWRSWPPSARWPPGSCPRHSLIKSNLYNRLQKIRTKVS